MTDNGIHSINYYTTCNITHKIKYPQNPVHTPILLEHLEFKIMNERTSDRDKAKETERHRKRRKQSYSERTNSERATETRDRDRATQYTATEKEPQ